MAEYAENSQIVKGISHIITFTSNEFQSNIYIYDETTAAFMKDMVISEDDWLFENDDYAGEYYPIKTNLELI